MSPFTKNSEMTSLILDSLPMGVLFCDMDYIIRFVNKAYADLLGRRPEELLGCDITEISKVYGVSRPTISIKIKRITKFLKNFNFNATN